MNPPRLKIAMLGLSITSSWGNGHATTYRGLVRELVALGHDVLFLEREVPWYAENRDLPEPPYGRTELYGSLEELKDRFSDDVREADFAMVGSYVPEGVAVSEWVQATARGRTGFYDIDTPITLAKLAQGDTEYLAPHLIPQFDLYLSFTGGPLLSRLQPAYGAQRARVLYCSVDPAQYYPNGSGKRWDLGYLGTYSPDRQAALECLLLEPARRWKQGRFAAAGPLFPDDIEWPGNTDRFTHLAPPEHREFYDAQRFTLNVTRAHMVRAGYSPSVRLFEAAACGTPIISDYWAGLETIFEIGTEILVARSPEDTLRCVQKMPEEQRLEMSARARRRVLSEHTAAHRARELEGHIREVVAEPKC